MLHILYLLCCLIKSHVSHLILLMQNDLLICVCTDDPAIVCLMIGINYELQIPPASQAIVVIFTLYTVFSQMPVNGFIHMN